ncbi:hypothetical protein N7470_007243 [Penicillium chermesinum]|nr:hypothetical protein N7470_007243 [Penicillium chermesinum]
MTSQALRLPLLRGSITLEEALQREEDMLLDVSYPNSGIDFFVSLYSHRNDIAAVVSGHLGLGRSNQCRLGEVREWIHGSFNVCIPVYVENWTAGTAKRVLIRFPLPYKVGESAYPGNADEKLRCEAATYIWIQQHLRDIHFLAFGGFGLAGGQTFTKPENMPVATRAIWYFKRCVSWLLGFPLPCPYIIHHRQQMLEQSYLVMDYIDEPDSNSIHDEEDGRAQVANLGVMQALLPHITSRELRQGPFFYRLTDLHQRNIFVDNEWHIRTNIMRKGWQVGSFWFFQALDSPKGLFNIFRDHIQPRFAPSQSADPSDFSRIVTEYWAVDTKDVIEGKLKDKEDSRSPHYLDDIMLLGTAVVEKLDSDMYYLDDMRTAKEIYLPRLTAERVVIKAKPFGLTTSDSGKDGIPRGPSNLGFTIFGMDATCLDNKILDQESCIEVKEMYDILDARDLST